MLFKLTWEFNGKLQTRYDETNNLNEHLKHIFTNYILYSVEEHVKKSLPITIFNLECFGENGFKPVFRLSDEFMDEMVGICKIYNDNVSAWINQSVKNVSNEINMLVETMLQNCIKPHVKDSGTGVFKLVHCVFDFESVKTEYLEDTLDNMSALYKANYKDKIEFINNNLYRYKNDEHKYGGPTLYQLDWSGNFVVMYNDESNFNPYVDLINKRRHIITKRGKSELLIEPLFERYLNTCILPPFTTMI